MKRLALFASAAMLCAGAAQAQTVKLPEYPVNADCSGNTVYGGMRFTSGSTHVAMDGEASPPPYTFKNSAYPAGDVGRTIILTPGQVNDSSSSPPTTFVSTIASVATDGLSVEMAANATFTATGYKYGMMRLESPDNATAINATISYAHTHTNGGKIVFPAGVCSFTGPITVYDNIELAGQGDATVLQLRHGSNSDGFVGNGFSALTGTNNTGGVRNFAMADLVYDGERGPNTATGIDSLTGTGAMLRIYGYEWHLRHLKVVYAAGDGLVTEWSSNAGNPLDPNRNAGLGGMEALAEDIKFSYGGGCGWLDEGPHDSRASNMYSIANATCGLHNTGNGSPLTVTGWHGYGDGDYNLRIDDPNFGGDGIYAENGMLLRSFNYNLSNANISGNLCLTLGLTGDGPVYQLHVTNTHVSCLNSGTSSGYRDSWAASQIDTINGGYLPEAASGTPPFPLIAPNYIGLSVGYGSAWPFKIQDDNSSVAHFIHGGSDAMTLDASHNIRFLGPIYLKGYTVSTLPGSPSVGEEVYVTDASSCTYGGTPTGGGSTYCRYGYDGIAWRAGE